MYDNLCQQIVGSVTFPFTNFLYNRKSIIRTYKELNSSEHVSKDFIEYRQLVSLKNLIHYCYNAIPFYQTRFREIGFTPDDLKNLSDIKKLPILSRNDVIEFAPELVDTRFRSSIEMADKSNLKPGNPIPLAVFKKHKLIKNRSSGSTGVPTFFYENGSRTALNWAHEFRLKSWYGFAPGMREVRMVRNSLDGIFNKTNYFRRYLWNHLILPGINVAEEDYVYCHNVIKQFKPKSIWGFTSAIAGLAEYIVQTNYYFNDYQPLVVVGWAAPVYEYERKIIKKAFRCPVSNIYGSREVGHIAGLCPDGNFHINQENILVECDVFQREANRGELLVTTLDISPMPFLRYRMGDIGELCDSTCACGRTLKIIKKLCGRTNEIFFTKTGRMISPNFWCRIFMEQRLGEAVQQFQVIYKKDKNLKIKIQKGKKYSPEIDSYLSSIVSRNFSDNTILEIEYVKQIAPQISGKYQMVINESL